jgi:hypothetical protein
VNVNRWDFLKEQLLFFTGSLVVLIAGLYALLFYPPFKKYRFFFWALCLTLAVFTYLKAKGYYAMGLYPIYIAFGAVYLETALNTGWKKYLKPVVVLLPVLLFIPIYQVMFPNKSPDYILAHSERYKKYGLLRWEDGNDHALPQDYADMLGWDELVNVVDSAVTVAGNEPYVIYGENYGQAGAVCHLRPEHRAHTYSFADSYRLWAPEHLPNAPKALIYINDEIGDDVKALFASITEVGAIRNPLAIEYGTKVWLCREPRSDMSAFWAERVQYVRRQFGIPMH